MYDLYSYFLIINSNNIIKGVLADILEPIMGKGLIPADLDTWKQRRRGNYINNLVITTCLILFVYVVTLIVLNVNLQISKDFL